MNMNRCFHCGNKLIPSIADLKISYEELVVEVQDAPCEKCSYCSRISFPDDVYSVVERFVDTMKPKGISGTVVNYYENIAKGLEEGLGTVEAG